MREYQLIVNGGDEIVSGPVVSLTDDEVKVIEKVFGGPSLKGDWNGVLLIDVTESKKRAEEQHKKLVEKEEEEKRKAAAEKAKRDSYIALDSYGTTNAMALAFQKAMKEKAGE